MPDETPIQFPHYEQPVHPKGIPIMWDAKQGKPFTKLIKNMLKLPRRGRSTSSKSSSVKLPKAHRYKKKKDL